MARPKKLHGEVKQLDGKTGNYYYFWTAEGGRTKRVSTGTSVYKEALEFQLGREKGEADEAANKNRWRISDAVDYYNRYHLEIGDTIKPQQIRSYIKNVTDFLGLEVFIDSLTPTNFSEYRLMRKRCPGARKGAFVKEGTIQTELRALKSCINFCVKEEAYLGKVPFIKIGKQPAPKDRWLTDEEAGRLLIAMQGSLKSRLSPCHRLAAIAWGTGKRKRAIEMLQWSQVNFETGLIDFRKQGEREGPKKKGLTAMSPWMIERMREFYNQRVNNYVLDSPCKRDTQFRRIVTLAGFDGVSCHTLRHTWGTRAAQKGLKLFEIAEAMGITQKTAERNYIHHCLDFQKAAVAKGAPPTGAGKVILPEKVKQRAGIMARRRAQA